MNKFQSTLNSIENHVQRNMFILEKRPIGKNQVVRPNNKLLEVTTSNAKYVLSLFFFSLREQSFGQKTKSNTRQACPHDGQALGSSFANFHFDAAVHQRTENGRSSRGFCNLRASTHLELIMNLQRPTSIVNVFLMTTKVCNNGLYRLLFTWRIDS